MDDPQTQSRPQDPDESIASNSNLNHHSPVSSSAKDSTKPPAAKVPKFLKQTLKRTLALSAEITARLLGEDQQSSGGVNKPPVEKSTSSMPESTPRAEANSGQSAASGPAPTSAPQGFDIEKLLSSGSLGNDSPQIPTPVPPQDFDLEKLLSSGNALIENAPDAVQTTVDTSHQSIALPSSENAEQKAAGVKANVFIKMSKGRTKLSRVFKGTLLDTDALREFALTTKSKEEARLKEEMEFLVAPSQTKPSCPIVKFRKSSDCPVSWDEMSGGSTGFTRVRYCDRCRLNIYDLDGLETAEAEELVVQREGQSKVNYFQRKDKKFQVKDCRVGAKKKYVRQAATVAAACVVIGLTALALTIGSKPTYYTNATDQSPAAETAADTKPIFSEKLKSKNTESQATTTATESLTVPIPENSESSEAELTEPPVADESGVLSHPFVDRKVTPPGGY